MEEQIIPKPMPKTPVIINILFYISILALIVMTVGYFYLINLEKNTQDNLSELEKILTEEKIERERELEKEIFGYQKKIKDFSTLLDSHQTFYGLFEFLEKNCHPKVWFSTFNIEAENHELMLTAQAENFQSVEQQILILKDCSDDVLDVELSGINIEEEGAIGFSLKLSLNPELFDFNKFIH
jgi:hypothetical protein